MGNPRPRKEQGLAKIDADFVKVLVRFQEHPLSILFLEPHSPPGGHLGHGAHLGHAGLVSPRSGQELGLGKVTDEGYMVGSRSFHQKTTM